MKAGLNSILKQPLLHVLLAGALIFVAYALTEEDGGNVQSDQQILVDREALLNFMQYREQAFNRDLYADRLDKLPENDRQALIRDYVREEVLYREAVRLGLEKGDNDIRLRLVQKMNYLLANAATEQPEPLREDIERYYGQYANDYVIDPVYTFTHIFFDNEIHTDAQAHALAEELLQTLQRGEIDLDATRQLGDRFRYLRNYEQRNRAQVVNNFGEGFADELDQIKTEDAAWAGPFASRFGWHLVLLRDRTEPRIPPLQEIYAQVVNDYQYEIQIRATQRAEDELMEKYAIAVELN